MASVTNMTYTAAASIGELVLAEIIESLLVPAAYAFPVAAPLVRTKDIRGTNANVASFPKWPLLAAAAVNENVDLTNTLVNTTEVSITAGEVGIMVNVSDKAVEQQVISDGQLRMIQQQLGLDPTIIPLLTGLIPYANECAKAVIEKMETDLIAEGANAGLTAGTTTADMQVDDFVTALFNLENANAPKPYHSILHAVQVADLRRDIISNATTAFSLIPDEVKAAFIAANMDGFVANLMGVQIWQSSLVPTANAGADRQGFMLPKGPAPTNEMSPIGLTLSRVSRVELERDSSLRSTEVVVTADYGVGTVNTAWFTDITTDA